MKLTLHQDLTIQETEITIRCNAVDRRLSKLMDYIRQYSFSLEGKTSDSTYYVPIEEIFYIDSTDGRSFLYTKNTVYESKETLTVLEQKLFHTPFVRISKNCILNTSFLQCVSSLWNHRLEATLLTGEKLIVSRNYISVLKEKLSHEEVLL